MKVTKFLPAVAMLALPLVVPMTAYAATDSSSTATTTPAKPATAVNGLSVSGDVVLSGVCEVEGQFKAGQMMVFRAQVLEANAKTALDPKTTTVTVNLANGTQVKMNYHGTDMWVGTYVIPPNTPPGALPYTISAKDANGNTGLFVPMGMPPMIVNNTVTIAINKKPIAKLQEEGATVPLYPIIQLLKKEGMKVSWNGSVLTLTDSALPAKIPNMGGSGKYSIVVNGTTVFRTTGHVQKAQWTHQNTTYISTDIFGFLVDASNRAASFAGNVLNFTTPSATSTAGAGTK